MVAIQLGKFTKSQLIVFKTGELDGVQIIQSSCLKKQMWEK